MIPRFNSVGLVFNYLKEIQGICRTRFTGLYIFKGGGGVRLKPCTQHMYFLHNMNSLFTSSDKILMIRAKLFYISGA